VFNPPLDQDTNYFFKIVAAGRALSAGSPAIVTGSFFTGTQSVDVVFDHILVNRDGDPGDKGEFSFYFGAGGADNKTDLGLPWPRYPNGGTEDIGDGQASFVNRVISIPNAPRRLWVGVHGRDSDDGILTTTCFDIPHPSPTGPLTDHSERSGCEDAWVWNEFDTFDNGGELKSGFRVTPFTMSTGNFGVAFTVFGNLRITASPGAMFRMHTPAGILAQVVPVLEPGRLAAVGTGQDRVEMVGLGADGAVYHKTVASTGPGVPRDRWTRLGGQFRGPVTAVASGPDRVSLFALGPGGGVFHKTYADGDSPDGAWEELGGDFAGPVAAAVGPKGRIELFGWTANGTVFHRTLDADGYNRAPGEWESIGGEVSGSLTALYTPRTGLSLFALGRDGSVLHKSRVGAEWCPGNNKWESLGGDFDGLLSAKYRDDGTMFLVVFEGDRTVHTMPWENYPEDPPARRWEQTGTIDSLSMEQPEEPERTGEQSLEHGAHA